MKHAIITVGLGFGDEGKGATVDYLTRKYAADLIVRYCGGSQAGHNVQLPDGRRHTFSQFGAGTLAGLGGIRAFPRTYLGPNVIIDPPAMSREAEHLAELGVPNPGRLVTIHPRCLVTTPWLKILNQLRELARGNAKHGSCGMGIGETRSYWLKHGQDALFAADLRDRELLRHKLELQRQRVFLESQELIERITGDFLIELDLWNLNAEDVANDLTRGLPDGVQLNATIPDCQMAIFEGAQGVLLDEYRGFHPHTTWSTVTPHHAWELIDQMGVAAVAVLGLTRAYTTRHGAGPLPTYDADLTTLLRDPGNPHNRWQGNLRCGWLDLPLLRYAAAVAGPLDGLVVNHLDQIREGEYKLCEAYRKPGPSLAAAPSLAWQGRLGEQLRNVEPILSGATQETMLEALGAVAPVLVTSQGPCYLDRSSVEVPFRIRRELHTLRSVPT
jgi:adenylosuccinate synthase